MERWRNRVAVVTGANSGIGAAICKGFLEAGLIVVGIARRENQIADILTTLPEKLHTRLYSQKCDVRNEEEVKSVFQWINSKLNGVDILVNAAAVFYFTTLTDRSVDSAEYVRETLDTQIFGVVFCVREAIQSMKARNVEGHIINLNSLVGHRVPKMSSVSMNLNIAPATKYALRAMSDTYRHELNNVEDRKIRVSCVSPGLTTDTKLFSGVLDVVDLPLLRPKDISDAILFIIGTPPHVEIADMVLLPIGQEI